MGKALFLLWCSSLAAADLDRLRHLVESNRFFALRTELEQSAAQTAETLFYQGVLACRFGKEEIGVRLLQQLLATSPGQEVARRSHEERAWALERLGLYNEASREWNEALRLASKDDPKYSENENTGLLMASLGAVARQTVDFTEGKSIRATRNRLRSWDVPVEVNHVEGSWIFDTGADQSTITESEAKRMGLEVVETKAYVEGCCTGEKNRMRLAVASEMQFGPAHLHDVVLLVLADESLKIAPLHYQITGILGIPVMRALGSVEITKQGLIRIHDPKAVEAGEPNLFFDGEEKPFLEIRHNGRSLQMMVDTGSDNTVLNGSFRNALTREEIRKLVKKSEIRSGASGTIRRQIQAVPNLRLEVLNKTTTLRKVSLSPEQPEKTNGDGIIGMDALFGGFRIDFEAMRLELD